jgi:hypothetical protein
LSPIAQVMMRAHIPMSVARKTSIAGGIR